MRKLICAALLFTCTYGIAQSENALWKKSTAKETSGRVIQSHLPQKNIFDLDVSAMKKVLGKSPKRENTNIKSNVIITLPNGEGNMESFKVYENAVMAPELAAKYPEIKSYIAVGVDNPKTRAYISNSPLGFKSMTVYPNKETVFIEPVNADKTAYTIYKNSDHKDVLDKFECGVIDDATHAMKSTDNSGTFARGADDGKLRTYRLALSCTGEYTSYFGGSKAGALAGMNNTLTRINGIYERDLGVRLVLVANNDNLIYTNANTDPYSTKTSWPSELQATLTSVIGEANYDIGHLFDSALGGGNAGCIGCIGVDNSKGRGYTSILSPYTPEGDRYDIKYAAHEIAHQLGANHTFTNSTEGANPAQMEPGSGSTVMSYAGTSVKDIQQFPDDYFHAISIQQITDNLKAKTCGTVTNTGNATPVVNAGLDYIIPKGTPFMLTGTATDANTNETLTYCWEQMDLGNATSTVPTATATTGPLFRSYQPTTSPVRYFPNMNTILAGLTTTPGYRIASETLPGVARTLNFRLTVRDNRIGGGANNADDMVVTVNGVAGPFTVNSQNTAVTYAAGTSQTINWTVAGTTANGVNCANVDILLSTDGGQTFPITLVAGTPNDGSQNVIIPNNPGTKNRIMVKGSNHIFFDVNNADFTITGSATADTTAPTASTLSASGTTTSSTNLSWTAATDNTGITGYDVYQNGVLKTTITATSLAVTGLTASTAYSFYVKAKDAAGNVSTASNTVNITTLALADTTAPTASTLSASGTTTSSTNLFWTAATDNTGVTGYNVYQNGVLKTTTTTTSLTVSGLSASTTYNFYVTAKDAAGNVSSASNTINVTTLGLADTTAPTASTLSASGTTTSSTNLSWTAATDNTGVTGYNVYQNGVLKTTTTATSLVVSGLSASTTYNFYVTAKDAAGNVSTASNIVTVTTLSVGASYCTSTGGTNKEYINRVQIGSINNLSGNNNGYGDYTMQSTNLMINTTVSITITPAWNGSSANEGYTVWIDYNQDGNFASNEVVFKKSKTKDTSVSGSFVVPSNAVTGTTRMRVSMKYNGFPTACETFTNGEVEDYTVNLLPGTTAKTEVKESVETNENLSKLDFKLYPNPVKGDILNLSNLDGTISYRIYSMTGQQIANGNTETNSINVSALKSGIYIIEVTDGMTVASKRFIKE
ncbi:reprolysin-like metallopeptidase [Flavobacterium suncheonense]|uniref:reprolysin-like metallopeptidase n=1 Tax=Flavobacterium suncheonense TaxID=350894 RepID=UPI0004082ACF|nr:GEVED domain-containing protein [Flavobacterium suncheonense]